MSLKGMPCGRRSGGLLGGAVAAALSVATPMVGTLLPGAVVSAQAMEVQPLEIATAKGVIVLEVEVAQTDAERTNGLMYRTSLPEQHGMLFDFKEDQPVYMWMKNTYIPLDMLFIRSNGTIARIAANATPHSTETISSGEPVRAVVEIGGGEAARLGIAPGDRVAPSIFKGK
ncbi:MULTISPECIES: DUF192 domain-containing protein [unclassified Xanthobacter]|uniref:DUF192 domain-containing protein n=1 Tax=unclassified Xanthobacter TaxID=2623496 RepID=UPI001EE07645|nr:MULTISPECIES: DUF192 domain-containing protein [unclassified Xanthobacter]